MDTLTPHYVVEIAETRGEHYSTCGETASLTEARRLLNEEMRARQGWCVGKIYAITYVGLKELKLEVFHKQKRTRRKL